MMSPRKKLLETLSFDLPAKNHSRPSGLENCGRPNSLEIGLFLNSLGLTVSKLLGLIV